MKQRRIFRERLRRNSRFRSSRQEFMKKFPDYPHGVWTEELIEDLDQFITQWGMAPIDPDSKEFEKDPLYYYQQVGKDGAFLIRVYPWTTEEDIIDEYRRIRQSSQPGQIQAADSETFKKMIDLLNRGEDFHEIGRRVFRCNLNEQGQKELDVDIRFEKLVKVFLAEDLEPEQARERALAKIKNEDLYRKLGYPYKPGDRTKNLERKCRQLYELLKAGIE